MKDRVDIYSTSVKCLLLLNQDSEGLDKNGLLYLIALSDFYFNNNMNATNLKNINSLGYYIKYINEALLVLLSTDMIKIEGNKFKLSVQGIIFMKDFILLKQSNPLVNKMQFIFESYNEKANLDKVYEELTNRFILKTLRGEDNNENWIFKNKG